jgi:hypothetical protein
VKIALLAADRAIALACRGQFAVNFEGDPPAMTSAAVSHHKSLSDLRNSWKPLAAVSPASAWLAFSNGGIVDCQAELAEITDLMARPDRLSRSQYRVCHTINSRQGGRLDGRSMDY